MKDEIVEEVRAVREAYAARFNYDLAEMFKDLNRWVMNHVNANHNQYAKI